mmetsp:Transcript_19339/g.65733  ORF Transcript_19339/g.65733 Transcript_19339/m.65733 type:complete len:410 (-) Transcript_19339:78-1307(-)|eukprot:CAMPEP_0183809556 /NCGR_PEP_ID=MMETSP0803_2-20130417/45689_1 /TAXON_ID=195967 /ORGANISM="Crustomastix stigmata, Strain CCMP3273" /LENGTH=409 /DNA_ID=CAMNT_0026054365 /DNA_START=42 /DNA_END=1271 /DNA_ORIENTATION=-
MAAAVAARGGAVGVRRRAARAAAPGAARAPRARAAPRSVGAVSVWAVARPQGARGEPRPARLAIRTAAAAELSVPEPMDGGFASRVDWQKVRVGVSLAGWFFLNAVFAIYNKKTLNCFPYPWLLSWIQIAFGAAMMVVAWGVKALPAPKIDMKGYLSLVPTATLHLIAHVSACACYNFSNVSFMQMVKAAEPACSVVCLALFFRTRYSFKTWLTLVPIIAGVALGSAKEINFSMIAFVMAMMSNVACAFRGVTSKQAQADLGIRGINLYAAIAIVSSVLLLPFALLVEGPHLAHAFADAGNAMVELGYGATASAFLPFLLTGSAFYHLYNQTAYQALAEMTPLTHSIANTVKRVIIICASLVIFRNPITPLGACSAAVAIGGTFLYSLARQAEEREKKLAAAKAAPPSA